MPIVYDDDTPAAAAPRTIHYDDDVLKGVKAGAKDAKKAKVSVGDFPPVALADAAAATASGMFAKPLSDVAGLAATGKEMISPSPGGGDPAGFKREVQNRFTYQPRTPAGSAIAEYNPMALLGKLFGMGGEKLNQLVAPPKTSGPVRAAVGNAAEEAFKQAPAFIGAGAGKAAPAAEAAAKGLGRDVMQSALKPDMAALRKGNADKAIDTLLEEGINVSRGGAEKLRTRIETLNDRIAQAIDKSPAMIDKKATAAYLQDTVNKFQKQVTPLSDLKAIQDAWDEFLAVQPDKIPVRQAQELKQGTYKALGDKSYNELKRASTEAQKTLARGLKEEIAKAVPEVRALNAEESKLINALSLVERRALMEANKNPAGLGWLTTKPRDFAFWMADRSGLFKSLVARMIYSSADVARPVGAAAPVAGMAATASANQLPPPPPQ